MNDIKIVSDAFVLFVVYDNYKHFFNVFLIDLFLVSIFKVWLDDNMTIKILAKKKAKFLTTNWLEEFDKNNIIRTTRVSLGIAAKAYKEVNETDNANNVLGLGEAE